MKNSSVCPFTHHACIPSYGDYGRGPLLPSCSTGLLPQLPDQCSELRSGSLHRRGRMEDDAMKGGGE